MSTDRIVLIAKDGTLSLAEGDEGPWVHDGRMYERPITLAALARNWPDLYDWMIVALQRFKEDPTIKGSDWVSFKENQ